MLILVWDRSLCLGMMTSLASLMKVTKMSIMWGSNVGGDDIRTRSSGVNWRWVTMLIMLGTILAFVT